MVFATRSPRSVKRTPAAVPLGLVGTARVGRRTTELLARLRPGDIAVIDHPDLDRGTAHRLVDAGVAAVVNASPSISGRYPALGAEVLVMAGVTVVDRAGPDVLHAVADGSLVRLHEGGVHAGDVEVAHGAVLDAPELAGQLQDARDGMAAHLTSFTHNTAAFLRREQALFLHRHGLPRTSTHFEGRPVVVVVAGHKHREQLASARRFIAEARPVLVGVDRGADALLAAGHVPDVVVLSDVADTEAPRPSVEALRAARDVVVCLDQGSPASARAPWDRLGVRPLRMETTATTEDAALLIADRGGAGLVVGVGVHATLEEFLDRHRAGLASTFLTRLALGPRLVDGSLLPRLYSGRVRARHLAGVALAGLSALIVLVAALAATPTGRAWVEDLRRPAPAAVVRPEPPVTPSAAPDPRAAYADTFAGGVAARVYAAGLAEKGVALVTMPGAEAARIDALIAQVAAAGGTVTGVYSPSTQLLDPDQKPLVDTLGSQLTQQLRDDRTRADATAYDRVGALLGSAVGTRQVAGAPATVDTPTILQSLAGAGLVGVSAEPAARAPLVLVVLGSDTGAATDPVLEGLVQGLAARTRGVVVAGDGPSAVDGSLARLRTSPTAGLVTTVDGIESAAGAVTAVLALIRSLTSTGGAFGASSADGVVPLG